jgi:arsenical pump membrane protein
MWKGAGILGALVVLVGAVPLTTARDVVVRLAPILVFLVAVTVLAELADEAGVFEVAARECARWARGSTLLLWLLVVVLATVATVFLSLDTTAVLLTPVVLALAQQLGIAALPFAMTTVWLANTASMLLPVSNLTNLLAQDRLGLSTLGFASAAWPAAVAAVVVTAVVLLVAYRRSLRGRYDVPEAPRPDDAVLFRTAAAACLLLGPLAVAGIPVAWVATALAAVLVVAFAWRRRASLRWSLVPGHLVVMVVGLFLVVAALQARGLTDVLVGLTGTGDGLAGLLRHAGVAAASANVVNNLPAYAALEPTADGTLPTFALLVGVNCGPLVLLWGSLATLLWRERCAARGLHVPWQHFARVGLVGVPLVVVTATAALALAGG